MFTRKDLFDNWWDAKWFDASGLIEGTSKYSSSDIQSMHVLMYLAIDGMEDALTMPEDSS